MPGRKHLLIETKDGGDDTKGVAETKSKILFRPCLPFSGDLTVEEFFFDFQPAKFTNYQTIHVAIPIPQETTLILGWLDADNK